MCAAVKAVVRHKCMHRSFNLNIFCGVWLLFSPLQMYSNLKSIQVLNFTISVWRRGPQPTPCTGRAGRRACHRFAPYRVSLNFEVVWSFSGLFTISIIVVRVMRSRWGCLSSSLLNHSLSYKLRRSILANLSATHSPNGRSPGGSEFEIASTRRPH